MYRTVTTIEGRSQRYGVRTLRLRVQRKSMRASEGMNIGQGSWRLVRILEHGPRRSFYY